MKKILVMLLICLFCIPAFAETEDVELMPYIGRPFDELYTDIGGELDKNYFDEGVTVYLYWMTVTARHTAEGTLDYGWENDTVFYISVSGEGYTLNGFKVGDKLDEIAVRCAEEGWTEAAEAPGYCDIGYEKNIDGVKYTFGVIKEYDTDWVNFICVYGEYVGENVDAEAVEEATEEAETVTQE